MCIQKKSITMTSVKKFPLVKVSHCWGYFCIVNVKNMSKLHLIIFQKVSESVKIKIKIYLCCPL